MLKDNEVKGIGNFLDFGERWMDTRIVRLGMSTDPLYRKFPWQSPYAFAGNNPILNVDNKGLEKTTYTIILLENTGKAYISRTTSPGLMAVQRRDMYDNVNYDWYDYSVVNVTSIGDGGITQTSKVAYSNAGFRTNTLIKSETRAQLKVGEKKLRLTGLKATKETGGGGSWTMTTKSKLFPGNEHDLNRSGRGSFINIDDIQGAFGMAGAASSIKQGAEKSLELLQFLKEGVMGADAVQQNNMAPINLNGNDTSNCDVPGGCGQLHVTTPKGNTQVAVPIPEGKTKDDY